jgi:hypothetical protein
VNKSQKPKRLFIGTATAVLILFILAPIIFYGITFGGSISDIHSRWGEMGSFMAGIYSPAIAFLALVVLIKQVESQEQINKHQFDQAFIQQARSDIQFYLEHLDKNLNQKALQAIDPEESVRDLIQMQFMKPSLNDLMTQEYLQLAQDIKLLHPRLFAIWSAIYPILDSLSVPNENPYKHNHSNSVLKIITMLSFETCVALDNYHYCLTEGRLNINYQFSDVAPHTSTIEKS